MSTSTATAYKYSVAGPLPFGAPKCEKAQKSSGFWANRTYRLCIKDNVLIDVDRSKVLGNGAVESPVMGIIAPVSLSGGVKTLILIDKVPDKVFNASNCGDNCAAWLLRIGSKKDVVVNLRHIMEFGEDDFEIYILNTNTIVHNMEEFISIAGRYV